ncbi:MAG: phosphoglycerate kinase, partial [Gemmatimonadales bacterium]
PDRVAMATALWSRAGDKLVLPTGAVIAQQLDAAATTREVARDAIPPGWAMYDIDSNSARAFGEIIAASGTVLWNGPMGVFETPPFDRGTLAVAQALAQATRNGATTIVGGGDSAAAVAAAGLENQVTHVSTGGGASLEFLEGRPLPGVDALDDA